MKTRLDLRNLMFNYHFGNGKQTKGKHLKHLSFLFARLSFRLPCHPLSPLQLCPVPSGRQWEAWGKVVTDAAVSAIPAFSCFSCAAEWILSRLQSLWWCVSLPWSISFPSNCGVLFGIHHFCSFLLLPSFPPLMPPLPVFSGHKHVFTEIPPVWLKALLYPIVGLLQSHLELAVSSTGQAWPPFTEGSSPSNKTLPPTPSAVRNFNSMPRYRG